MLTQEQLTLAIFNLAHQNEMSIHEFLEHLTTNYTVDNSDLPKDKHGCTILEDGNVGVDVDMTDAELLTVHWAAAREGISTNDFVIKALEESMKSHGVTPKPRKPKALPKVKTRTLISEGAKKKK